MTRTTLAWMVDGDGRIYTLADRTNLTYEVLIGRNILRDVMLVDVGKEYATELPESIRKSNGNES